MPLIQYNKKRDLKSSKEPKNKLKKSSSKKSKRLIYLIHEHHATHLHWDLRLEMNNVLKSWAVPKTPTADKEIKRLAIQVEDHPISYAKFKGIIPEGNYGAGEVKIWDTGNYELIEKTPTKIIIEIHGKKLKGRYCLIKTNYGTKKNNWLFFKI
jgi:DNA ligase D-like protein (predicted 3'-phosphoesterase)